MFIQHLNNEQQATLIAFAKKIISVDGHIDEKKSLCWKRFALSVMST